VSNAQFLRASVNALRKRQGQVPLDAVDFLKTVKEKMTLLNMSESLLTRSVNEGFSGGEKKRNEILQMLLLEPRLAILDETDSGLDIDALKIVAQGVNTLRHSSRAIVLITHYQRLLDYIEPDYVHVLSEGKIVHSGDKLVAHELEAKGYTWLSEAPHVDG
jgi:Fe-S cluster assembly ATP-binding protein